MLGGTQGNIEEVLAYGHETDVQQGKINMVI